MTPNGRVVWISHRGLKERHAENTLGAFRAAVDAGFGVLETDLRLTRDGHVVLCHDPTLARLTGKATVVAETTRAELAAISLGGANRLLFLDEFAAAFSAQQWLFDVKPEMGRQTIEALVRWLGANGRGDALRTTTFTVWSEGDQAHLERLVPGAKTYARDRECWRAALAILARTPALGGIRRDRVYALPPRLGRIELYTPQTVDAYRRRGGRVLAFLPETDQDVRKALALGVDEILTNGRIVAL